MYKEHPLAKKLKDSLISDYKPKWSKNYPEKVIVKEKKVEKTEESEKLSWDTF